MKTVGLLNPATVAWELVPYSFIADWFVPVGDYLTGLTADCGLVFKGGSVTSGTVCHVETEFLSATNVFNWRGASARRQSMNWTRTVFQSTPLPSLYLDPDPLSWKRWLDVFALVRSSFR
jgi:hypothetical protein